VTRTATVRTRLPVPETAARAVRPDNTDDIETRVDDGAVVTTVHREDTGGLRSTVDDYLVNLAVAERTRRQTETHHE